MTYDPWLPIGYEISGDISAGRVLYSGDTWQIVRAKDKKVLLVKNQLANRWITAGLLKSDRFIKVVFGSDDLFALVTDKQYDLSPIEENQECWDLSDALTFAKSLKFSREHIKGLSFMDSIYSETDSCLLPTYTIGENIDDGRVLGYWLSNGVNISINSFRRFCSLVTWLDVEKIKEVIEEAGLILNEESDAEPVNNVIAQERASNIAEDIENEITNSEPCNRTIRPIGYFALPGRPKLEKFFNEQIIDVVNNLEKYKRMGIDFPTPTILYGPPGSGKTYAIEQLASFMDWPVYYIDSNSVASSYIHDTSKKIAEVFKKATKNAPSIIIIDEMESYLSSRGLGSESGTHHIEEVAEFLREIPNAAKNRVLVFGMTNMLEMLDSAAIRQGRFDHKLEVALPTKEEVSAYFDSVTKKLPMADGISMDKAIETLTNRPFSDAAFVIREAGRLAAKNDMEYIDQTCIDTALEMLPNTSESKRKLGF